MLWGKKLGAPVRKREKRGRGRKWATYLLVLTTNYWLLATDYPREHGSVAGGDTGEHGSN